MVDHSDRGDAEGQGFGPLFFHHESLPGIVESILGELERRDTVQHVCRYPLPSEETVIQILNLIAGALFPGYFGKKSLAAASLHFYIGAAITDVFDLLSEEITRCLVHERYASGQLNRPECEAEARKAAFALLKKLPELLGVLDEDIRAAYEGDPAATGYDEVIFCYPGFRALMIQRIAHELHLLEVPWLPRIMTEYAHRLTGIDIHPGAQIGRNFFIDHGTGVVIGETTLIGRNVRLYQGVTLGGYRFRKDEEGHLLRGYRRHPTLEDGVIIYSNASVLGPITVGAGSVIGANVILTRDVDPGTTVMIEKPRHRIRQAGDPGVEGFIYVI
jgi:serine O-acetyltransferase